MYDRCRTLLLGLKVELGISLIDVGLVLWRLCELSELTCDLMCRKLFRGVIHSQTGVLFLPVLFSSGGELVVGFPSLKPTKCFRQGNIVLVALVLLASSREQPLCILVSFRCPSAAS